MYVLPVVTTVAGSPETNSTNISGNHDNSNLSTNNDTNSGDDNKAKNSPSGSEVEVQPDNGVEVLSVEEESYTPKEEKPIPCRNHGAERIFLISSIIFGLLVGTIFISQIENINNELIQNGLKYTWHWVFCIEVVAFFLQILSIFEIVPWDEIDNDALPKQKARVLIRVFNMFFYSSWLFGSLLVVSCFGSIETFGETLNDTGRLNHYSKSCLICLVYMVICIEGLVCVPGEPRGCEHIVSICFYRVTLYTGK